MNLRVACCQIRSSGVCSGIFAGVQSIGYNLACYSRGNLQPLRDAEFLVCHGTPLSVAYKILREGVLRVGDGHHYKNGRTVHGIFVCSEGDLFERMGHARDRSTTVRDTHWVRLGNVPSGWSCPCVLAFELHPSSLTILDTVGGCKKSALEEEIGWTFPHSTRFAGLFAP